MNDDGSLRVGLFYTMSDGFTHEIKCDCSVLSSCVEL
jgi:hypothetical protein